MENVIHMQDLIYILMKRIKLLIVVPFVCAAAGLVISVYFISPVYEAQSDLLVNQTVSNEGNLPATTDVEMNLRLIETYQYIINSVGVRELVQMELDNDFTLEGLKKALRVETNTDSQIISLIAKGPDPESASNIVNAFAKVSQQEISNLMHMNNVRIMTKASAKNFQKPVRPKPVLYTIISFLGGIILTLIYIALAAYFNTKIRTRQDVENHLHAPLLGSFSMIGGKRGVLKKDANSADIKELIALTKKDKVTMEAIRNLRVNILFQQSVKKLSTILVTSAEQKEGKSVSSVNLALAMAMDNKKTLLIDADLRKFSWKNPNEEAEGMGLTNYLSGQANIDELIHELDVSGLYMITSGPLPPNPTELLGTMLIDQLLADLENRFDMIIIDSSPMIFSDAAVLATKVDGCIFINHAGKTKVAHAQQAMSRLKRAGATILGVVLNNKKEKQKTYSYQ